MKIGIYGGTFDPPHNGHVHACKSFLDSFDIDRLYVIPTSIPPHKIRSSSVSGEDRLEMARLAFSDLSQKIEFSDIELKRAGKSYTSDTLKHFKSQGVDEILLLCGTDMFVTLDTWHEFPYIFEVAKVVCIRRESDPENTSLIYQKTAEYEAKYNARIAFIDVDAIEISSSDLRNNFFDSKVKQYIPTRVYDFIVEKGFYKNESN